MPPRDCNLCLLLLDTFFLNKVSYNFCPWLLYMCWKEKRAYGSDYFPKHHNTIDHLCYSSSSNGWKFVWKDNWLYIASLSIIGKLLTWCHVAYKLHLWRNITWTKSSRCRNNISYTSECGFSQKLLDAIVIYYAP